MTVSMAADTRGIFRVMLRVVSSEADVARENAGMGGMRRKKRQRLLDPRMALIPESNPYYYVAQCRFAAKALS